MARAVEAKFELQTTRTSSGSGDSLLVIVTADRIIGHFREAVIPCRPIEKITVEVNLVVHFVEGDAIVIHADTSQLLRCGNAHAAFRIPSGRSCGRCRC